jgi:DNA modification methylase
VIVLQTAHVTLHQGDALACLRELADASVDCVVTSPPYWGLRDYGVAGQLGLERTPPEFVAKVVEVFREVRRVLADHGTLWLNLGDSYAQGGRGGIGVSSTLEGSRHSQDESRRAISRLGRLAGPGLKPKDLVGIPWMVAFALRADGWYLRSDIIWAKPNPMPESVTDRPTKAHDYVFLLTKSARYFYDGEAIAEPVSLGTHARVSQNMARQIGSDRANGGTRPDRPMKAHRGRYLTTPKTVTVGTDHGRIKNNSSFADATALPVQSRNSRTVWSIVSQPYAGAHLATFPEELPRRCILAGCPDGGVVLDPFAGSGTTLAVARDLGRRSVGIELNPEYVRLIEKRCAQQAFDMAAAE